MSFEKITIEATINASPSKVWEYYTQPDHIINWNFADASWCCPNASNDLRVGGKYSARMEAKDGSFGFDFEATYTDVIDQEQLSYTMPDNRTVTVTFDAENGKTKVTTLFDAEGENPIEMQRVGWQAILNNFKSYVESN